MSSPGLGSFHTPGGIQPSASTLGLVRFDGQVGDYCFGKLSNGRICLQPKTGDCPHSHAVRVPEWNVFAERLENNPGCFVEAEKTSHSRGKDWVLRDLFIPSQLVTPELELVQASRGEWTALIRSLKECDPDLQPSRVFDWVTQINSTGDDSGEFDPPPPSPFAASSTAEAGRGETAELADDLRSKAVDNELSALKISGNRVAVNLQDLETRLADVGQLAEEAEKQASAATTTASGASSAAAASAAEAATASSTARSAWDFATGFQDRVGTWDPLAQGLNLSAFVKDLAGGLDALLTIIPTMQSQISSMLGGGQATQVSSRTHQAGALGAGPGAQPNRASAPPVGGGSSPASAAVSKVEFRTAMRSLEAQIGSSNNSIVFEGLSVNGEVGTLADATRLATTIFPTERIAIGAFQPWQTFLDSQLEEGVSDSDVHKNLTNQQKLGLDNLEIGVLGSYLRQQPYILTGGKIMSSSEFANLSTFEDFGGWTNEGSVTKRIAAAQLTQDTAMAAYIDGRLDGYPDARRICYDIRAQAKSFQTYIESSVNDLYQSILARMAEGGAGQTKAVKKEAWKVVTSALTKLFVSLQVARARARSAYATSNKDPIKVNAAYLFAACQETAILKGIVARPFREFGAVQLALSAYLFDHSAPRWEIAALRVIVEEERRLRAEAEVEHKRELSALKTRMTSFEQSLTNYGTRMKKVEDKKK